MDALPPRHAPRIGWVCDWLVPGLAGQEARAFNFRDTAVAALLRLDHVARVEKLHALVRHNAAALPPGQRAMRIASHALPCFTHPDIRPLYDDGGARGPGVEAFRAGFARLSRDAQGLLTVENDEVAHGLDDLLPLAGTLPVVLDLHHHWVATG